MFDSEIGPVEFIVRTIISLLFILMGGYGFVRLRQALRKKGSPTQ
jgi:ABC-type glycerol-3-phosphate transport system permease component